jgi:hypothetical protein
MNTDEVIDMNFDVNICRLCTREQNPLRSLFDGNENLPTIIKVLSPCIQVSLELVITCTNTISESRRSKYGMLMS